MRIEGETASMECSVTQKSREEKMSLLYLWCSILFCRQREEEACGGVPATA
jgi:hypothetical protein